MRLHAATAVLLVCALSPAISLAEAAPPRPAERATQLVPAEAQREPLDVEAATRAYLALVSGPDRERSDAYYEGGYWLRLWDWLAGLAIAAALLFTRASAWMRGLAERITSRRWLHAPLYWIQYLVATTVLGFPLTAYEGYFREHRYGLSNMSFGAWLGDEAKGLLVGVVLGGIGVALLYAVLRRAPRTWWLWGAAVMIAMSAFAVAVAPVFIAPLFNTYRPLQDAAVRERILSLARANGIPARDVWEADESRQSDRISANVSGFLGTQRITLNDNLLARASLPQIEAVMAHEMGHYVLNHVQKMILFFALAFPIAFAVAQWAFRRLQALAGARWGIRGVDDPAGLPVLLALLSTLGFLASPVLNAVIRTQEGEADQFGLNAAGQPDAFAQMALALGEYRKLDPGPWEELLFFDHPSGRARIEAAMRWKAEHLALLKCRDGQGR